jgi:hypothetical protein
MNPSTTMDTNTKRNLRICYSAQSVIARHAVPKQSVPLCLRRIASGLCPSK